MAKKNKKTATERREIRLHKARQWITTYNGTPKKITSNYRKRFHVDVLTAVKDLQAIGVEFTHEYLEAVKKSEEERIRQIHLRNEKKRTQELDFYNDSDDTFAFIAGHTSGGAPYGITWEELGIEPYAPYEELMEAYALISGAVGDPDADFREQQQS